MSLNFNAIRSSRAISTSLGTPEDEMEVQATSPSGETLQSQDKHESSTHRTPDPGYSKASQQTPEVGARTFRYVFGLKE